MKELKTNLLLDNNILALKSFIIYLNKKTISVSSYKKTIAISMMPRGYLVLRSVFLNKFLFILLDSEALKYFL